MKIVDIVLALISGRIIGFLVSDFLKEWGIEIGFFYLLVLWIFFPLLTLFCLWVANIIGRKLLFAFEGAKFVLVGSVATVVDLKFFELMLWLSGGTFVVAVLIIIKGVSFLAATFLKFWGNKYWVFSKPDKENFSREIFRFFAITFVGIVIDVSAFYYISRVMPPPAVPFSAWIKLSVIFAALAAALWNFWGYKFLVFKK